MGKVVKSITSVFSGAKDKAIKTDTRAQEVAMAKQKQKEDLRLAEADSEVARRKATAKVRGQGRSLLVGTSERGTAANPAKKLGG